MSAKGLCDESEHSQAVVIHVCIFAIAVAWLEENWNQAPDHTAICLKTMIVAAFNAVPPPSSSSRHCLLALHNTFAC